MGETEWFLTLEPIHVKGLIPKLQLSEYSVVCLSHWAILIKMILLWSTHYFFHPWLLQEALACDQYLLDSLVNISQYLV